MERPTCAGWHIADAICDGDDDSPPCRWREKCVAVTMLAGGRKQRTKASVARVLASHTDNDIEALLEDGSDTPPDAMIASPYAGQKRGTRARALSWPATDPAYCSAPLRPYARSQRDVEDLAEAIARRLGVPYTQERRLGLEVGDVYVRWADRRGYITEAVRRAKGKRVLPRTLAICHLRQIDPTRVTVPLAPWPDAASYAASCLDANGVTVADGNPKGGPAIDVDGITDANAPDVGRWIARLYLEHRIRSR